MLSNQAVSIKTGNSRHETSPPPLPVLVMKAIFANATTTTTTHFDKLLIFMLVFFFVFSLKKSVKSHGLYHFFVKSFVVLVGVMYRRH